MAERLYLDGYLTYPRTETNTYPKNFDLQAGAWFSERVPRSLRVLKVVQGAVRAQCGHHSWGTYSQDLLSRGLAKAREGAPLSLFVSELRKQTVPSRGVDMGDHPPITPVRAASESQLGDAYRLYATQLIR